MLNEDSYDYIFADEPTQTNTFSERYCSPRNHVRNLEALEPPFHDQQANLRRGHHHCCITLYIDGAHHTNWHKRNDRRTKPADDFASMLATTLRHTVSTFSVNTITGFKGEDITKQTFPSSEYYGRGTSQVPLCVRPTLGHLLRVLSALIDQRVHLEINNAVVFSDVQETDLHDVDITRAANRFAAQRTMEDVPSLVELGFALFYRGKLNVYQRSEPVGQECGQDGMLITEWKVFTSQTKHS